MPYIRDSDFARLSEIAEAIKDFSTEQTVKDHAKKALRILKGYEVKRT